MATDLCPYGNRQTHTHYRKIRKDHPISKNVTLRGRTNSERIFAQCGHQYLQGERSCHMLGSTFYNGDILGIIIMNTSKVRKRLFSGRMPASSSPNRFPHCLISPLRSRSHAVSRDWTRGTGRPGGGAAGRGGPSQEGTPGWPWGRAARAPSSEELTLPAGKEPPFANCPPGLQTRGREPQSLSPPTPHWSPTPSKTLWDPGSRRTIWRMYFGVCRTLLTPRRSQSTPSSPPQPTGPARLVLAPLGPRSRALPLAHSALATPTSLLCPGQPAL